MNIPSGLPISTPQAPRNLAQAPLANTPPADTPPTDSGVTFRDVAAIGAGVVAGSAGAVVGLGEGLIRGGIKAYPQHIGQGADLGRKIASPLGAVVGAGVAVTAIGGAAAAIPVFTVLAAAGGALNGTIEGTYTHGQTEIPKAIDAGARWGEGALATAFKAVGGAIGGAVGALITLPTIVYPPLGKKLIPEAFAQGQEWGATAGEVTGSYLGAAVGGLGGAVAGSATSLVKGLPQGYETGKACAKEAASLTVELPDFAKAAWSAGTEGGAQLAGDLGGIAGGVTGFATATGATVISGVSTSIDRASGWAGAASDFVRKDDAKSPSENG